MSFGVKYRNTYTDLLGVSHQVDILEEGYSGSITSIYATSDPVIFAWDASDDTKYATSIASSIDINFRSPSRQYFRSLFTASKFKYQVKHYTATVLDWVGYLIPDLYSEVYDTKDFAVNIKAADGLGLLVNMDFVDANGDAYTGLKSDFDIIKIMLDKLGNERSIITAINIYETTMDDGTGDDPLKQAYTNCDIFYGMNCAEVLDEILKPYGAVLFQDANGWNIIRFSQLKGSYERRIYNSAGTYSSSGTYDPSKTLTDENATLATRNVMVIGATSMQIMPAMKELNINQDYGYQENIIPGGDMNIKDWTQQFASNEYVSNIWKMHLPSPYLISENVTGYCLDKLTGEMYLAIFRYVFGDLISNPSVANWASTSFYLKQDISKKYKLSIEYRFTAYDTVAGYLIGPDNNLTAHLIFVIKQGNNFLNNNGKWVNWTGSIPYPDHCIDLFVPAGQDWLTSEFTINDIPADGDVEVRIYKASSPLYKDPDYTYSVDVKNIGMQVLGVDTSLEFKTTVNDQNNYIPSDIEILCADLPDETYKTAVYKNGKFLSDGTPTLLWKEKGNNIQEPLVVSLARIITDQHVVPSVSYDAVIRHAHCSIGSVITDPWDGCVYRVLSIMSYSVANCEMRCRLCEIIDQEELLTEGGEEILTELGETILTD